MMSLKPRTLPNQISCPSCASIDVLVFHEQNAVPVHSVLNMPTHETALNYPKGDISLAFCQDCGFISNVAFDPGLLEYSSNCEESQGFSPTFTTFAHRLANHLVEKYALYNKNILEIGCGKGDFLILLCEIGQNRGVGFDPAYVEDRYDSEAIERIIFIKDFYSEKYSNHQADFICCRMTLEHIHPTSDFVSMVRRSIGNRSETIIFFQVPDVTRILRDCAFEDIYYEHCSYFSPGSLARLFRKCGFNVLNLETDYDGQYLIIEAKPATAGHLDPLPQENDFKKLRDYVSSFRSRCQDKLYPWQNLLQEIHRNNKRTVLWGSGSKGVAFLTTLNVQNEIKYVVDINPYRQGTYMAGTGQKIVAPEFLCEYKPHVVIIMNPIYRQEINKNLKQMGLNPELLTL